MEHLPSLPPLPADAHHTSGSSPAASSYQPFKPPTAWCTYFFLSTTIGAFLWQWHVYQTNQYDAVGNALAFSGEALNEGRYWTLLSYAWAHSVDTFGTPWLHIVGNMLGLFYVGPLVEAVLGHLRFFFLYLGGTIFSALVWYYWPWPSVNDDATIIGASGAVFALVAAAGTALPTLRVVVYIFFLLPVPMTLRTLAIGAVLIEVGFQVSGYLSSIGHTAHLGGAFFGLAYTWICLRLMSQRVIISAGNKTILP